MFIYSRKRGTSARAKRWIPSQTRLSSLHQFCWKSPIKSENVILRRMSGLFNLNTVSKGNCKDFITNMKCNWRTCMKLLPGARFWPINSCDNSCSKGYRAVGNVFWKGVSWINGNGGVFWLMLKNELGMSWCEQHVTHGNLNLRLSIDSVKIRECSSCRKMLYSVCRATRMGGDSNIGTTNAADTPGRGIISKIWNH